MENNHLVFSGKTHESICKNCGKTKLMPKNIPVSEFVAHLNEFNKAHGECKKPPRAFEYDTGRYYDDE